MHRLRAVSHHPPQQLYKRLGVQPTLVGAVPEATPRAHRGGRTDRLPLARTFDHRRLTLLAPGLAVHAIGTKARLIPEIHLTARGFCLCGNGRIPLALPRLNSFRIALVSSLQDRKS